jgi:tetratricopeptide (TPR) repeat protein
LRAKEQYEAGIAVLDGLLSQTRSEAVKDKAIRSRATLAQRLSALEAEQQAVGDWENVVELAEKTPLLLYIRSRELAQRGRLEEAVQSAAKLRELAEDDANTLYNAACAYGLCAAAIQPEEGETLTQEEQTRRKDYVDLSLSCLKEAVAAGYDNREHARQDRDLAVVWNLPEFKKLLESSRPAPPPLPEDKN